MTVLLALDYLFKSGDTSIVGQHGNARFWRTTGGMAYIFTQNGDIWGRRRPNCTEQTQLMVSCLVFGEAIDGDTAIVSDYYDNVDGGK